jgi:excisionase family DNA binding protein
MNEYLNVKEVAMRLDVKPVTIYKWLREGRLKGTYFKIGGVYRFKEDSLHEIIEGMIHNG